MKLIKLLVRVLFLGFLSYHAYTSLTNLQKNSEIFQTSYKKMENTLSEKFKITLPQKLQSEFVTANSETILKIIDILVLFLSFVSLFTPSATWNVGLIFFLNSVIYNNYFNLTKSSDLENFEPLCINLALLGLSFILSSRETVCGKDLGKESEKTVVKKADRKGSKGGRKKKKIARD